MTRARYGRLHILDLSADPAPCVVEVAPTPVGPWRKAGLRLARKVLRYHPAIEVNCRLITPDLLR